MSFQNKWKVKKGKPAVAIGIGAAIALILSIALCTVMTSMVNSGNTSFHSVESWMYAIRTMCGFLGAVIAASIAGQKRMQVCLITAAVYLLSLLSITALLFDGQYSGVLVSALIIMLSGLAAGVLGVRTKKSRKMKGVKRLYR